MHSSKIITTSESSTRWICIDSSGVRNSRSPFTGDENATPSSSTRRSGPRLKTWKPPESVRIGRSQPMNRCRPPWAAMTSRPGRSHRWNVLPRTIRAPRSASSRGRHRLHGPVGADRHEHRRFHGAVREFEPAAPGRTRRREDSETHGRSVREWWRGGRRAGGGYRTRRRRCNAAPAPTSRIVSRRPHCDMVGIAAGSDGVPPTAAGTQREAAKSNAFFHARWKSPE